jgi:hypothetical protein
VIYIIFLELVLLSIFIQGTERETLDVHYLVLLINLNKKIIRVIKLELLSLNQQSYRIKRKPKIQFILKLQKLRHALKWYVAHQST